MSEHKGEGKCLFGSLETSRQKRQDKFRRKRSPVDIDRRRCPAQGKGGRGTRAKVAKIKEKKSWNS